MSNTLTLVSDVLGSEPKLKLILILLNSGPELNAQQIATLAQTQYQTTAKHLVDIARSGLITARRSGRDTVYRFNDPKFNEYRLELQLLQEQRNEVLRRHTADIVHGSGTDADLVNLPSTDVH